MATSCGGVDFNICPVIRGNTWIQEFVFYTDTSNSTTFGDISGWVIWIVIKSKIDGKPNDDIVLVQKTTVAADDDSAAGRAIVSVSSEITAGIEPGKYYYEFIRDIDGTPPNRWTFARSSRPDFEVLPGSLPWDIV